MNPDPRVSIIIPAYESQATVENCLQSIQAQTPREFEVIMIDSSPSDGCERIVREHFPWVHYEHVKERMLPHEARNYGVTKARSDMLIFTDPDIYPLAGWIARLLDDHSVFGDVIVGSVRCYGSSWLHLGTHFAKFDLWLPGGHVRCIEIAPTMNLLCPRGIFDRVGGFPGERMIGDTIFSWEVAEAGNQIHFSPEAEVLHHHVSTWPDLLLERFARGREFGFVRVQHSKWSRARILLHLMLSILPLRWVKLMLRTLENARSANLLAQALWTLPVSMSAQAAWLWGECRSFVDILMEDRR